MTLADFQEFKEFPLTTDMIKEQDLKETLQTLNLVNFQIAELSRIKEELEARTCALVEHGDDGQKTYTVGKFKATVSTGYIYSLDKSEYEMNRVRLQSCFDPVKIKTVYEIDKSIIRDLDMYGSEEERELIFGKRVTDELGREVVEGGFIKSKPKKLHVRLTAGV